ncbi:MAG: hypothetical protein J7K46_09660 [Bacteroidales bacterium]|nr:hypothetical protein [Bacteroidales bacterium]
MDHPYRILEVNDKKTIKEFLHLPLRIYKNDKNWIRPLDRDIEDVFNPGKNKEYRHGEAVRWILLDKNNKTAGRVAAFTSKALAKQYKYPVGGMGFFECIEDREAAFMLFDQCKNWLENKGVKAMDGPINFGKRDRWWGLLAEGFFEPVYCIPYNPPYYKDFFKAYGFRNFFNQYTYYSKVECRGLKPQLKQRGQRLLANPRYSFDYVPKNRFRELPEMLRTVFNKAWAGFPGVNPFSKAHATALYKSMKPILDEKLLWFGYYNGKPISFFLMIPEINQVIKHLNGKLNFVNKLRFLYYKDIRKVITRAVGILFGVVPEHQGKGVEAAMILSFANLACSGYFRYKQLEMNWIGDFNPTMMKVLEQIGATIRKTHITYRYIFDPEIKFERAAPVNR